MKRLFIIIAITLSSHLSAQTWLGVGFGSHVSNPYFKNSEGIENTGLKGSSSFYASGFYMKNLSTKSNIRAKREINRYPRNVIFAEFGYKRSSFQDEQTNLQSEWNLDFASSAVGFLHHFKSKGLFGPYVGISAVADLLTRSTQTIGFQEFDIKDELAPLNVGVAPMFGIYYRANHDVMAYLNGSYTAGISNLEDEGQTSRIGGLKLGLSILFKI